ncbi:uncharacterized protein OCT59_000575 [Rhizophagus irregularis]|uniref:uncharacterized protein n=1 Tax=Rhizophagus irregularis TaxID=588596 RepID=UPI003327B6D1|nr:hypothetical protein OCT59_000575 [Rhizophagus irregularis]
MFSNFGEQKLKRVDSSASSKKIAEWKKNAKTREAYRELFENQVTVTPHLLQELAAKEDSEQSPEISSIIEESSDADDGNSSSYEELLKSLDSKFS